MGRELNLDRKSKMKGRQNALIFRDGKENSQWPIVFSKIIGG